MGCGCGGGNRVVRYEVLAADGSKHGPFTTRQEAVKAQGDLPSGAVVKTITAAKATK